MTGKISSDLGVAQSAVSGFDRLEQTAGKQVHIGKSNIHGLKRGAEVCNQMLGDITNLSSTVKAQANKFPELALLYEGRDNADARSWGFD
ncbi:hypothetical protein [Lactococcus garvieae]|uniref:hypothetical protein n=1 Tax=Lactococcus garvieae TaxID=1363 RepID=UPI00254E5F01|nr:hypothetical protein [Lactococcus garvieae]